MNRRRRELPHAPFPIASQRFARLSNTAPFVALFDNAASLCALHFAMSTDLLTPTASTVAGTPQSLHSGS
jgi:hypothetical protein